MKRLGDTQTFKLAYLDTLVHTGQVLSDAIDDLPREGLKALADRFELSPDTGFTDPKLRKIVKRHLVGAAGLIRESRETSRVS